MRKKFTLLFASLLAFAGVAKAGVTDLPEMSTEGSIKYYTIKNTRSGKYANYAGDATKMTQVSTAGLSSLFYFTASDAETAEGFTPVMIHNAATTNKLEGFESWTEAGKAWFLSVDAQNSTAAGLHITNSAAIGEWNGQAGWNALNDGGSSITNYAAKDAGSVFEISAVTDFAAIFNVPAAKDAAIAELENYATVSTLYPAATDAVAAVNAVTPASNGLEDLKDAVEAINAIVVGYRENAYKALEGKFFTIQTLTTERSKGFMQMATSNVVGSTEAASPANIWQFVCNGNGTVNVYNPYTGKYLCEPQGNSAEVAVTTDKATAGAYVLNVNNDNPAVAEAKVKLTSNGKSVHMAGGHTLVRWDNGGASEWQVAEVTDFSSIISSYKTASIASMDEWKKLSVVFDAALIETAKTAIGGIATTDWATFAAIDAELKKVTDAVAAKMFTFQTIATDASRNHVWVSADAATMKAIGADNQDYNAVWSLRHAGGISFYLFNELNQVYMGKPSSNGELTKEPTASYSFEMITDKGDNVVEMKCGGETLHAANTADNKLMNYDGDEDASRWMVNVIDVTKDIKDLLAAIEEDDYAEVPALGQYSKAAYDALVVAGNTAKTVAEVEEAIAEFKVSKNLPVFTISNGDVKDYAKGKSIYDGNNGKLNFKVTNVFDKTMWWALDMAETSVKVIEEVGIYNVGTGNGFWGAASIKVTETSENDGAGVADDNIFLFYTTGNNTPIHFQNDNQEIVRWASTEANSGSAAMFTYIGNTYDLNKLTDEYLAAGLELATLNVPAGINIAAGVNNYHEAEEGAVAAAKAKIAEVLVKFATAEEIAAAKAQFEAAIEGIAINQPEQGKYYRIRCTAEGMKRIQSTLADNERLEMKGDNEGMNAGAIFQYTADGGLMSYTEKKYIDANAFVEEGVPAVEFSAAANGKTGCYNIKIGDRYIFGAGDTIDSGSATDNRDGYNWWLEEIAEEELPKDPTGVERVVVEEATVIYDLLGRRVEKMEKGIYIVNGKKVLVK